MFELAAAQVSCVDGFQSLKLNHISIDEKRIFKNLEGASGEVG